MLITEQEDIKPLIGMDWLREFNWTTRSIEGTTTTSDQSEKEKINTNFEKFFKKNQTVNETEIKAQLRPGHPPTKQNAKSIPYQLQSYVEKEINNLIQSGHLKYTECKRGLFRISGGIICEEK